MRLVKEFVEFWKSAQVVSEQMHLADERQVKRSIQAACRQTRSTALEWELLLQQMLYLRGRVLVCCC